MVNVYLNPGKLNSKIYALKHFYEATGDTRAAIDGGLTHDPVKREGGVYALTAVIKSAGDAVNNLVEEISNQKMTIERLNSSGIAAHDNQGGINLEVPDGSGLLEDSSKFQKWAQGAMDANDLRSGKDKLPSGRSIDQVRESMKLNKDDSTYASTFIDRVGPENLTKIGDQNPVINKEASTIGEILATASQTWDKEKSKRNADLIIGSVDDKSEWDRIPILNEMIGGHDADNDGVSDLKFGSNFLAFMGDAAEKLPYREIMSTKNPEIGGPNKHNKGRHYPLGSYDPIFGIADAMTNNGEAAAMFFGKKGVNASRGDIKRIHDLAKRYDEFRNDDATVGVATKWTDNLAIMSGKMSELGRINTKEASPEQIALSDQAALGTGVILNSIGQSGVKLSSVARPYVGIALKNYAPGVDQSIRGKGYEPGGIATRANYLSGKIPDENGKLVDDNGKIRDDYDAAYWGGGIPTQPNFSDCTLSNLTGQLGVSDNGANLRGLQQELGYIANRRMSFAANADSEAAKQQALEEAISSYRQTEGFVAGAISREGIDQGIKTDNQIKAWIDGISGATSIIPTPEGDVLGKGVKHLFQAGVSYVEGRAEAGTMKMLEDNLAYHQEKATEKANDGTAETEISTKQSLINKLIESGVIDQDKLAAWPGRDEKILNADGTLNYENLQSKDYKVDEDALKEKYGNGADFEKAKSDAEEYRATQRSNVNGAYTNFEGRMREVADPWVVDAYKMNESGDYSQNVSRGVGDKYQLRGWDTAKGPGLNKFGEG